jgi:polar amino acid transport system substrate-binding protein
MPPSILRGVARALALLGASGGSRADTLILLTGEWPPYTGVKEPQGGSMAAIVRAAYANQGDSVKLGFFSWYRVARLLQDDSRFTASFPHYHSAERAARCHFSQPIGSSPLGIATRAASSPRWRKLEDLHRYRIGTVKSYVNVPDFDRLVAGGSIRTLQAVDDVDNLRNLVAGKVDAIVIDRNVFAYLQRSDGFRRNAVQLALDPRVLAVHNLYMCFPRTEKGRLARDHFDAGLVRLQAPGAD